MNEEKAQEVPFRPDNTAPAGDASGHSWGSFLLDQNDVWDESEHKSSSSAADHQSYPPHHGRGDTPFELKIDSVRQRISAVSISENPLLEASRPLLRALSEMPDKIPDLHDVELLKDILKREINHFSMLCDEVNIPWKKMAIIRYCICTALDETAHSTPWGISAGWSQSNLLNHFESDNDGGNKFFLLIGRISMSPGEYADVIEILLRILGLGFEGRYSIPEDGDRQLIKIRQRLLSLLQSHRRHPALPAIMGVMPEFTAPARQLWWVPLRVTLLLSALVIASCWIGYKYLLFAEKQPILVGINALYNVKYTTSPQVKPPKLSLEVLLKAEIQKRLLSVDEDVQKSHVVLHSDKSFSSGSATLSPEVAEVIRKVAVQVKRVNGRVQIVGHTDSTPIRQAAFPNNQVLSTRRAEAVAEYFVATGIPADMITVKGMADKEPVSTNATAAGRAKNRRVEFFVTY